MALRVTLSVAAAAMLLALCMHAFRSSDEVLEKPLLDRETFLRFTGPTDPSIAYRQFKMERTVTLVREWSCRSAQVAEYSVSPGKARFRFYYVGTERPIVLISAAGSTLYRGARFSPDSPDEAQIYSDVGLNVIHFEIPGYLLHPNANFFQERDAVLEYVDSEGGRLFAMLSLEYVIAAHGLSSAKVFTAGSSASGNLALRLAAEPWVSGCAVFAPALNPRKALKPRLEDIVQFYPRFEQFLETTQLLSMAYLITCPTMVVQAIDDRTVSYYDALDFVGDLQSNRVECHFVVYDHGGHNLDRKLTTCVKADFLAELSCR